MRNRQTKGLCSAVFKMLIGLVALNVMGCKEPGDDEGMVISSVAADGTIIAGIVLPTDTLLNLNCADVGVYTETCVLTDPENPYVTTTILEFDENNPGAENKFLLQNGIPAGSTGAKARFYLWATALARRASGENQYFTALALHELYTFNGDPLIRDQALKAYKSVLDNFFGSVVFFACCGEFFSPPQEDVPFSLPLNELVLERLVYPEEVDFALLIPDDPEGIDRGLIELLTKSEISEWGYSFNCQNATVPHFCVLSVNDG